MINPYIEKTEKSYIWISIYKKNGKILYMDFHIAEKSKNLIYGFPYGKKMRKSSK